MPQLASRQHPRSPPWGKTTRPTSLTTMGTPATWAPQQFRRELGDGRPMSSVVDTPPRSVPGIDSRQVRIHTDSRSAEVASALGARAFTVGNDVFFGAGAFDTRSASGRRTLAHELHHVAHQAGRPRLQLDCADDPWVLDRDGALYYNAREEAERRLAVVKRDGAYREYEAESFTRGSFTYWRVRMCGPVNAHDRKASEEKTAQGAGKKEQKPSVKGKVCLTFDDGPQDGTQDVLNGLNSKSAPAAFFLTGTNMANDPAKQFALVQKIVDNPRAQVGNHTFTHAPAAKPDYVAKYGDLSNANKRRVFRENYEKNAAHFAELFSKRGEVFLGFSLARLPGDGRLVKIGRRFIYVEETNAMKMRHVSWQFEFVDNGTWTNRMKYLDWQGVKGVASEVEGWPSAGAVILFHDRHWSGKQADFESLLDKLLTRFSFGQLDPTTGACR